MTIILFGFASRSVNLIDSTLAYLV